MGPFWQGDEKYALVVEKTRKTIDAPCPALYPPRRMGDGLQGAAADCNSAGETHAWFDSRVAHHPPLF